MYKYLLQSVEGIQWFGIITLLLFFGTFCLAIIRAFFSKKEDMQRMSNMPLED
ncbi:MAG: CcoQ/FixQ family Cbb3-type cytochrome c oxidase assembly chaperone [Saprospiraceae bacterium]|nr:CcoQ/FixQ family Cbb3-type cytochrome c oxidase assembly chaperone [Saprospiraceae bacterium]MCB0544444.1 CcoQ/FixQ family Cbb3-type cytochrome c oxidase assembly chaperone [Saprospiraceae bacterium]MCB0575107.1 CcoQ/FixQ family Cbb3-type cytochrome c oxidase assembly chaperone [Saprospiraceae bacterium]MCB9306678.1 CcoQ/FixQ family Cbb3-type cytochrome c oxidase assembly chaperone [Lewinellaceae bacterium]MCB9353025.1 CcoQ/FixQ family Cbb3-type cytochrome c oxidase assembly chaperone [Lewin